ncbi:sulfotransferase family 2 domain-containing protein [Fictibacillus iocasae]|uniref:Sulfotransferase family 2 domain-containing protein n=1 Tax=Fictibacillus iocasae TaxID=2715437 RepID=A0ABW2NVG2_9BACL
MFDRKSTVSCMIHVADPVPLFNEKFPIIFLWSPKSGCTSLIKWFYFQTGVLEQALNYKKYIDSTGKHYPWVHGYRMEIHQQQKRYKEDLLAYLLNGGKDVYKLVRNPYTRAVSSFFIFLAIPALHETVFPEEVQEGVSFKQYLYRIKTIGLDRKLINYHIAKQYTEHEEYIVRQFIRLENFETEIRAIEKNHQLIHSPISTLVQSFHHKAPNMKLNSKLNYSEVNMPLKKLNGHLPHYQSLYDAECKDLVWELFNDDFVKYGYHKHSI